MNRSNESELSKYDLQAATRLIIFVEDEGKEKEYEITFRNYIENKSCKPKYISAGGKPTMLSIYYNKTLQNKEHMIFLFDKDFDDFLGKIIRDVNVVYTRYYNIETIYISKTSVSDALKMNYPDIDQYFDYDKWICATIDSLKELLISFVLARKYDLHNVPSSYDKINKKIITSNKLNSKWIEEYIEIVKSTFNEEDYIDARNKIINFVEKTYSKDYEKLICGKILFLLLSCEIKKQYKFKSEAKKDQLNTALAYGIRLCGSSNDKFLGLISDIKNTNAYTAFI